MFCRTIVFQLFTKSNSLETCPLYVSVVCLLFSRQYEQNMTIFISLHELKDKVEKAIQLHTICEVQKHNPTHCFNNKRGKKLPISIRIWTRNRWHTQQGQSLQNYLRRRGKSEGKPESKAISGDRGGAHLLRRNLPDTEQSGKWV